MRVSRELTLVAAGAVALTVFCHGMALRAPLLWDDVDVLTPGGRRLTVGDIPRYFGHAHWIRPNRGGVRPYRPIRDVWLALVADIAWDGVALRAWPFHLSNLVLHTLNVWLVYVLGRRLFGGLTVPVLASLFFATHPVHVETITWAKNLAECLALLLGLLTVLAFLEGCQKTGWGRYWLLGASVASFTLALLTKESAAPVPIILGVIILLWRDRGVDGPVGTNRGSTPSTTRALAMTIPFWLLAVVYVLYQRHAMHGDEAMGFARQMQRLDFGGRLWVTGATVLRYLGMLFLPAQNKPIHLMEMPPRDTLLVGVHLLTLGTLLVVLLFLHLAHRRRGALGLWWLLLALAPVANFLAVNGARPLAEQRLYFPSVGYAFLLGGLFAAPKSWRPLAIVAAGAVVASGTALCLTRTLPWCEEGTFWRWAVRATPRSHIMHHNLAIRYNTEGRTAQAAAEYHQALRVEPRHAASAFNLGNLYYRESQFELAARYLHYATEIDPGFGSAHANLARTYLKLGRGEDAVRHFERAYELNPEAEGARHFLSGYYLRVGIAHYRDGRYAEAVPPLRRGFALAGQKAPRPEFYWALSDSYARLGDLSKALEIAQQGFLAHPQDEALRARLEEWRKLAEQQTPRQ